MLLLDEPNGQPCVGTVHMWTCHWKVYWGPYQHLGWPERTLNCIGIGTDEQISLLILKTGWWSIQRVTEAVPMDGLKPFVDTMSLQKWNHSCIPIITQLIHNIKEKKGIIHDIKIIISTTTGHAVSFSSIATMELTELPTHVKGTWQVTASPWPDQCNEFHYHMLFRRLLRTQPQLETAVAVLTHGSRCNNIRTCTVDRLS